MGTMTEMTRQGGEIQYIRRGERKAGETEEKAPGVLGSAIFHTPEEAPCSAGRACRDSQPA